MRAAVVAFLVALAPLVVRAEDPANQPGVPLLPGGNVLGPAPTTGGAFNRFDRLNLGLSWFAWSASSGLVTTAIAVGSNPPSEARLQTLALAVPLGTFYTPVFAGALWDGVCGDGLESPASRWRDAGGYGSVVWGVSWAVRAIVAGALMRPDAVWPAYVSTLAGSAVEAIGVAWLAAN